MKDAQGRRGQYRTMLGAYRNLQKRGDNFVNSGGGLWKLLKTFTLPVLVKFTRTCNVHVLVLLTFSDFWDQWNAHIQLPINV